MNFKSSKPAIRIIRSCPFCKHCSHAKRIIPPRFHDKSAKTVCSSKKDEKQNFRLNREKNGFRVTLNESDFVVPDQALVASGVAAFVMAGIVGPLLVSLAITAVSVGVTLSIGAVALSTLFIPLAIFSFITFLTFGSFLGGFALLGLGIFAPKLISMVVAGAGIAIGWVAFRMLMPASTSKKQDMLEKEGRRNESVNKKGDIVSPEEVEAQRLSNELREFDKLLADREYQRRIDKWNKRE
ncbi:hypothetical protein CEUSTIGMA_g7331.t1 [Chlamydomonas eustigma]|uniref:Uncharacterized protein n=1 Tax=Chlamydomonas eustigma TaxID=1157962 RepID=A0A250X9X2_9CHLO|nr:hypothetical protein CEUSTIGMA_g7331.t1 [Chlamydomonas eustigma]|eukprot:GAX79891.1 hypothetical protein CEUSTIGMA_g7331.t1 [Chlamydomonas eustigma]